MTESAGKKRLKILFFSQRFPYPMDTGGKIRTGKLLEQLKDVFDITLVSNVESPKDDEYLDQVKKLCAEFHPVPWKETKKYTFRFYLKLLRSVFSRYPFTVINDYSQDLEAALLHLTTSERFDLLICDFLQPSLNFRRLSGTPTLLFEHNIESVIPRRHFETSLQSPGQTLLVAPVAQDGTLRKRHLPEIYWHRDCIGNRQEVFRRDFWDRNGLCHTHGC